MYSLRVVSPLALIPVAVLAFGSAAAQTSAPSAQPVDRSGQLEEVVVTAEKRTSTVQDTPISITALSGEQLQQQGITNISDVVSTVPGLSMRSAGPGQTELEMRGLSSSGGASPTVGFYLNDYPLTAPAAALVGKVVIDPDLFDLNRVEVLRGPQGTLYGSGSMGGTVKLVANSPKLNVTEGAAEVIAASMAGGGFNRGGNLMLNVPLVDDRVAMRVVITDKFTDGWITRYVEPNLPPPTNPNGPCGPGWPGCTRGDVTSVTPAETVPRVNTELLQGGRAEFLAQPTDALKIDALAIYQRIQMADYNEYDLPPGITDAHYQVFNDGEPIYDEFKLYGVTITYDLGNAELTSASAYYSREENQIQDTSEAISSLVPLYGFVPTHYYVSPFQEIDTTRQYSEELRVASTATSPLQWIAGAFFSRFESTFVENNSSVPLVSELTASLPQNPTGILYQAHNPYSIKQYAIFGEGTYAFTNNWKATVGLRWYKFDSVANEETTGLLATTGNATPLLNTFQASNTGMNPKATLSYEENHDLTVYGTIARGFRPGGINQQIPNPPCTLNTESYGPDSIWNYEVGEKAKLLGNRLVINADVYYIQWAQVQQSVNQPCGYPLSENAGTATSYGPEIEVTALLTPELTMSFSGTYTHATLTAVNTALQQADSFFMPGLGLLNVPKYTETTSLTYTKPLNDNLKFMARLNNSYVGQATDIDFYYGTLPAYDLVGLRCGLIGARLSAFLFADNLTDRRAELGINTTGFSYTIPSLIRVATNQPRTVGVDFTYKF
jgi:iron complex outermembrane recepter protein